MKRLGGESPIIKRYCSLLIKLQLAYMPRQQKIITANMSLLSQFYGTIPTPSPPIAGSRSHSSFSLSVSSFSSHSGHFLSSFYRGSDIKGVPECMTSHSSVKRGREHLQRMLVGPSSDISDAIDKHFAKDCRTNSQDDPHSLWIALYQKVTLDHDFPQRCEEWVQQEEIGVFAADS